MPWSGLCLYNDGFNFEFNRQSEAGAASPGAEASEQSPAQGSLAQKIPLRNYLGEFWNSGWRGINVTVGVEKGQLVIDCSNRFKGFILLLHHVAGQTTYVAHKQYVTGGLWAGCTRRVSV